MRGSYDLSRLPVATQAAAYEMNQLASRREPFVFLFDFELERPKVATLINALEQGILYDFAGSSNWLNKNSEVQYPPSIKIHQEEQDYTFYSGAYQRVQSHLARGDIYLTNLTQDVTITSQSTLSELFAGTRALCRVLVDDQCVVFSPEKFITIKNGEIATFPMKGTRPETSASDAVDLLNDEKEAAEHATVVDLLRNDLSTVATQVAVRRYRYLERINTSKGVLLQTSSEIVGTLPEGYVHHLGEIVCSLLPAGSVSGAPKINSVRIAREVERSPRGYYTGVFGIWDGFILESAVLIRFVEKKGSRYVFRSGGGITVHSQLLSEYRELIDKVALPN